MNVVCVYSIDTRLPTIGAKSVTSYCRITEAERCWDLCMARCVKVCIRFISRRQQVATELPVSCIDCGCWICYAILCYAMRRAIDKPDPLSRFVVFPFLLVFLFVTLCTVIPLNGFRALCRISFTHPTDYLRRLLKRGRTRDGKNRRRRERGKKRKERKEKRKEGKQVTVGPIIGFLCW